MKFLRLFFVFLLFLFSKAFANVFDYPSSASKINNELKLSDVRLRFEQKRTFKNVDKPVVSSGDFVFLKDRGAYFYTKFPVEATLEYTRQTNKQANDIINAVMRGQFDKIENVFALFYYKENSKWKLGLKPKNNAQAAEYLSDMQIYGENYITQIIINFKNGNKTEIWFKK